jgi:hypothetical protein
MTALEPMIISKPTEQRKARPLILGPETKPGRNAQGVFGRILAEKPAVSDRRRREAAAKGSIDHLKPMNGRQCRVLPLTSGG